MIALGNIAITLLCFAIAWQLRHTPAIAAAYVGFGLGYAGLAWSFAA